MHGHSVVGAANNPLIRLDDGRTDNTIAAEARLDGSRIAAFVAAARAAFARASEGVH